MKTVYDIIQELSENNSRLFKEDVLKREVNNSELMRVIKMALDPSINYWIKKIPSYTTIDCPTLTLGDALDKLMLLSNRTYTGNAAIALLSEVLSKVDSGDAEVIKLIIERDLKCGVHSSTANKIWKKLIPEFSYMRCSLPSKVKIANWDWSNGIFSQEKADGMFQNVDTYSDFDIVMSSRNGTTTPNDKLNNIVAAAKKIFPENTRTHGEFLVEDNGKILPREIGNGILNSICKGGDFKNKNQRAIYVIWDQIPLQNAISGDSYLHPYSERFAKIQAQILNLGDDSIRLINTKVVNSYEEALAHYSEMLNLGKEGTVIKTQQCYWEDNTSKNAVKFKLECVVDLEIVTLTEGNGKNSELFGSVSCKSADGKLEVNVSGFTDEERVSIFNNFENIRGKIMAVCSNNLLAPTGKKTTWSLFLPRCSEIRDDKLVADTLEQIQDQFNSVISVK